jgi:hypothetical protein
MRPYTVVGIVSIHQMIVLPILGGLGFARRVAPLVAEMPLRVALRLGGDLCRRDVSRVRALRGALKV